MYGKSESWSGPAGDDERAADLLQVRDAGIVRVGAGQQHAVHPVAAHDGPVGLHLARAGRLGADQHVVAVQGGHVNHALEQDVEEAVLVLALLQGHDQAQGVGALALELAGDQIGLVAQLRGDLDDVGPGLLVDVVEATQGTRHRGHGIAGNARDILQRGFHDLVKRNGVRVDPKRFGCISILIRIVSDVNFAQVGHRPRSHGDARGGRIRRNPG